MSPRLMATRCPVLSRALLPDGNRRAPGMFSCFPGRERAKGWRSALSWLPPGMEHMGVCSLASGGRAAPSPGDMARPHSSGSGLRTSNHEHRQAEQTSASFLPASSALPEGTRQGPFHPCCFTQQLCFVARVFLFLTWLVEQKFLPGALEHRHRTGNSDWLQLGRGTSQAGVKEVPFVWSIHSNCLHRP